MPDEQTDTPKTAEPGVPGSPELAAGALVGVRQRTYLVEAVRTAPELAAIVALAYVDDDAQGQRLSVIWPAEIDAKVVPPGPSALRENAKPDDPRVFAAYLHAPRWGSLFEEDSDEDIPDEEVAEVEDAEVARATRAGASAEDDAAAKKILDEMSLMAESARDRPDAKIEALLDWMVASF